MSQAERSAPYHLAHRDEIRAAKKAKRQAQLELFRESERAASSVAMAT